MSKLTRAIEIACQVHADQTDLAGEDYILHVLEVLRRVRLETQEMLPSQRADVMCAAVLHDVLEDFDGPAHEFRRLRNHIYEEFGSRVDQALDALTRQQFSAGAEGMPPWKEPYPEYIERLCQDWIARRVKLADLSHNMDLRRMPADPGEGDFRRWAKYRRAYSRILEFEGRVS